MGWSLSKMDVEFGGGKRFKARVRKIKGGLVMRMM